MQGAAHLAAPSATEEAFMAEDAEFPAETSNSEILGGAPPMLKCFM